MLPERVLLFATVSAGLLWPAGLSAQDMNCSLGPPYRTEAYDPSNSETIEGVFRLVREATSLPEGPDTTIVRLRRATADERALTEREGIGFHKRTITHTGEFVWSDKYPAWPAEANGSLVFLGCRDCTDAIITVLYIAAANADGWWGIWRTYGYGLAAPKDSLGNLLPDRAGYFCAARIPAPDAGVPNKG